MTGIINRRYLIALSIFVLTLTIRPLEADQTISIPPDILLEYSLLDLKAKADEIEKRNGWLKEQNGRLREKIESIKGQEGTHNPSIIVDTTGAYPALNRTGANGAYLYNEAKFWGHRERELENKLQFEYEKINQVKRGVSQLNQELHFLLGKEKENPSLENGWIQAGNERSQLKAEINASQYRILQLKQKLDIIGKSQTKPERIAADLKIKQNMAKQKLTRVEEVYRAALEEEKQLLQEVKAYDDNSQDRMAQLLNELARLKLQERKMDRVLKSAKSKLKENPWNLAKSSQLFAEIDLKEGYGLLVRENEELKKELSALQQKLRVPEVSQ